MFRAIYKFFASLQFAIVLLSVIILASAVGTIYETSFNADVAQKYVYGAPWFNLWLAALCVNLFCVAAIRYPWKRHQTGFVITHAGIITLLIGAMIDRVWGIEGFIHLYATKPGTAVMELHAQELKVKVGEKSASTFFKLNTLWNKRPAESPAENVKVEIVDVQPVVMNEVAAPAPKGIDGRPGVNFTLQGPMMGRHDSSIFLGEHDDLMELASVAFLAGSPPASGSKAAKPADAGAELQLEFRDKAFKFALKSGETRTSELEGLPGWSIDIKGYYPNFVLGANGPDTRDNRPLRPAAFFELVGPPVAGVAAKDADPHAGRVVEQDPKVQAPQREKVFVFTGETPLMSIPVHGPATAAKAKLIVPQETAHSSVISKPNGLAFFLGDDGKLRYLIKHTPRSAMQDEDGESAATEKTGEVELEKPVAVGWAPGAEFVVHEFVEHAQRKGIFVPHPEMKSIKDQENVNQGIDCRVTIGTESKDLWVGQTTVGSTLPQVIEVAGTKVSFELANQAVKLPFNVSLKRFSAPPDEGSNEFSAFESILGFDGRQDTVWLKAGSLPALAHGTTMLLGTIVEESDDKIEFQLKRSQQVTVDRKEVQRLQKLAKPSDTNPGFDGRQDSIWLNADSALAKKIGTTRFSGVVLQEDDAAISFLLKQITIDKKDIERSEKLTQSISMNRPTTFPVSWYGPYLGICYKFSQASHHIDPSNPKQSDPNYSGVQVLRDPGWFFKWVGCIMICFGIFTMFYLRPYFNRPKVAAAAAAVPAVALETRKKKLKKA